MEPMRRIRIKNIRGAFGEYDPNTNQIDISSKLTKWNIPSKGFVRNHELMHQYIHTHDIKIAPGFEELVCDLYAVIKCKPRELSYMEHQFQKILIRKYGKNLSEEQILKINLKEIK